MIHATSIVVLVAALTACSKPDRRGIELAAQRAELSGPDEDRRAAAYLAIQRLCCPHTNEDRTELPGPIYAPACRFLESASTEDRAMLRGAMPTPWLPGCYANLSLALQLSALRSHAIRDLPKIQDDILSHLSSYQPTTESIRALLEYVAPTRDLDGHRTLLLSRLGEPDLEIVMGVMLEHHDATTRRAAVSAIWAAMPPVIEIPALEFALERAMVDRDAEVARVASSALQLLRSFRAHPRPIAEILATADIATLARRRFACREPLATLKLQHALLAGDRWDKYQASFLLENRARYCGEGK